MREKILNGFRTGRIPVLIATDVAARGLDIDHIDLVVHFGVPRDSEAPALSLSLSLSLARSRSRSRSPYFRSD